MEQARIVEPFDEERVQAEAFIRSVYATNYGARLGRLPERLIVRYSERDEILCAAGLRQEGDGFFSERYLDEPVEAAIARLTGHHPSREDLFEVTTLASRSPGEITAFIDDIISFGAANGLSWAFFTLTRRLSLLVRRLHLAPIHLADADAGRSGDPAAWGSYYATEPKVYAVCGLKLRRAATPCLEVLRHADLV